MDRPIFRLCRERVGEGSILVSVCRRCKRADGLMNGSDLRRALASIKEKEKETFSLHFNISEVYDGLTHPIIALTDLLAVLEVFRQFGKDLRHVDFGHSSALPADGMKTLLQSTTNLLLLTCSNQDVLQKMEHRRKLQAINFCSVFERVDRLQSFINDLASFPNLKKVHIRISATDDNISGFCNILKDIRGNPIQSIDLTIGDLLRKRLLTERAFPSLGLFFASRDKSISLDLRLLAVNYTPISEDTREFVKCMKVSPPRQFGFTTESPGVGSPEVFIEMSKLMEGPGSHLAFSGDLDVLQEQDEVQVPFLRALAETKVRSIGLHGLPKLTLSQRSAIWSAFFENTTTTSFIESRRGRHGAYSFSEADAICERNKTLANVRRSIEKQNMMTAIGMWAAALGKALSLDCYGSTPAYVVIQHICEFLAKGDGHGTIRSYASAV